MNGRNRPASARDPRPLTVAARWVVPSLLALGLSACTGELTSHAPGVDEGSPGETDQVDDETPGDDGVASPRPEASLHRLNKLEYNNSVRDLLGTRLRPADDFPPDASVGGFDNAASALSITPNLMNSYVQAARDVVEDAFASRPAFEDVFEEDDARLQYSVDRDANRIGGIVRLRGGNVQSEVEVPVAGPHTVVVRAQGIQNGGAAAPRMRLSIAGNEVDFDVPGAMQDVTIPLDLVQGRHAVVLASLNFEENAAENRGNDILFDRLVVHSDELVEGPARERVMICDLGASAGCAATIIDSFARRAWRRPLREEERASLHALHASFVAEGELPEEAIKLVLRAVLTSPKFLYRYRMVDDSDSEVLLDPYVLASRLSYFIWSSTPDEALLDAAASGALSSAAGIREVVVEMLADPRAQALADGFAEQWLDLRHLEQASPSAEVYPEFNEQVREAMRGESKLFFLDYLDNGASIASMLRPDFAYRDPVLAGHLGLAPPASEGFERVSVGPTDRRGVLALTAWLTSRSDSEHSSPIRRGSWIADNMLCAPVPPPPPGLEIGELEDAESGLSVRERLEMHRDNPQCSGCHARLDVLGMGFEVYDGVGRLIADPTLDSLGELPERGAFTGAEEMAGLLDPRTFVTCVSSRLFTYALGREAGPRTVEVISTLGDDEIVTLTLPDLITAIATSPAFSQPVPLK